MSEPASPTFTSVIADGARLLGSALDGEALARLEALQVMLLEWNQRMNLTAIRAPLDVARKHVLDSLAILPHIPGQRLADIGSGAGFPGLPLAIAAPQRHVTLIEGTGKKARFLEHVVAQLGLANVAVVNARAELWHPAEQFDAVIARALGSLSEFIRLAGHLAAREGRLYAMKGRLPAQELAALPRTWRALATHPLAVPGLAAERHLIVLLRQHAQGGQRL